MNPTEPKLINGRFQFKILPFGALYYPDRTTQLQEVLARKPARLEIELIGKGEINGDAALALRSVLWERWPGTRIAMHARSSLMNGSVLVWLLGDERSIREDAWVYFRGAQSPEEELWTESGFKFPGASSEPDLDEIDHARVLELINEYLPAKEFAGRRITPADLRQFGLIESEPLDQLLASTLGAIDEPTEPDAQPLRSPTETPQN